jgi:hypothetical protein
MAKMLTVLGVDRLRTEAKPYIKVVGGNLYVKELLFSATYVSL